MRELSMVCVLLLGAAAFEAATPQTHREGAAIVQDAPVDKTMTLGRTLLAAQMAAGPDGQRAAPAGQAPSDRLLDHSLAVLRSPWMRFFIGFDPATALRRVVCPAEYATLRKMFVASLLDDIATRVVKR